MGPNVHYKLTKEWAVESGFSEDEAERIADADNRLDQYYSTKPWCHFSLFGAFLFQRFFFVLAKTRDDLGMLGYALHCAQDGFGHGRIVPWSHRPSLDDWRQASPELQDKISERSLKLLSMFLLHSREHQV